MTLVFKNAIAHGRRDALMTACGICGGCVFHAVASALGLSVILATSATAFEIVKTVGAGYLVYLGIKSILAGRKARRELETASTETTAVPIQTAWGSFREGLLTNTLNPKVAVFYLMVLPQFIAPGQSVLVRSLTLSAIHIGFGFAILYTGIVFVDRLRPWLASPKVQHRIESVTGTILIALGLRLAMERR